MKVKSIFKFLAFVAASLTISFLFLNYYHRPKFNYALKTAPLEGAIEKPLELIVNKNGNGFEYSVSYLDDKSDKNTVTLDLNRKSIKYPPFVSYGDSITIRVNSKIRLDSPQRVLYELKGNLDGLVPGTYRVKILDFNGNIIDEKFVTLPTL